MDAHELDGRRERPKLARPRVDEEGFQEVRLSRTRSAASRIADECHNHAGPAQTRPRGKRMRIGFEGTHGSGTPARLLALAALAALAAGSVTGCGSHGDAPAETPRTAVAKSPPAEAVPPPAVAPLPPPPPKPERLLPRVGGTAVIAVTREPETLFDWLSRDPVDRMAADLVFRRLARPGGDLGELVADLAESWTLSQDRKTLRVRMKGGVRWEDGVELTSADVVFSEERARSRESKLAETRRNIEAVEASGPREVVFRFRRPSPDDPAAALLGHVYPRHLLQAVPMKALRDHPFHRAPKGSGPFRLETWHRGQSLTFTRRPDADPARTGPLLERVVVKLFADRDAMTAAIETGTVHLVPWAERSLFQRYAEGGVMNGLRTPGRGFFYVAWNATHPYLAQPEVRRAFTARVDRAAMATAFDGPDPRVAEGPVPPGDPRRDATVRSPTFDPERAGEALAKAGLLKDARGTLRTPEGKPVRVDMLSASSPLHRGLAAAVGDALRQVGFLVDVQSLDEPKLRDRIQADDFGGVLLLRPASSPVDLAACFGTGGEDNWGGFSDATVDRFLTFAAETQDAAAAERAFADAQRRIVELQPWTFLYFASESTLVHPTLFGADANPRDPISVIEGWWLAGESGASRAPGESP